MRRLLQLVFLLFCCPILALAQTPTPPTPQRRPPADHRIWLDVVVSNKAGDPVPSLQESDFTVFDDGQHRSIMSFQPRDGTSSPVLQS